jgi:hypothetical protein
MPTASPPLQRLEQAAHTGQVGRGQLEVGPAPFLDQRRQPVLLGPAVEHGHRLARGVVLRGDLEAAQVRGEEQDAAPAAHAASTSSQPLTLTTRSTTSSCGRSQIFGSSSSALPASAIASAFARPSFRPARYGWEIAPVGGRRQPRQPAGQRTEVVQQRQRQAGEETEQGG